MIFLGLNQPPIFFLEMQNLTLCGADLPQPDMSCLSILDSKTCLHMLFTHLLCTPLAHSVIAHVYTMILSLQVNSCKFTVKLINIHID